MKTTKEDFMSQYQMSVNQRKAHAQAMNRALAESYERLMDLCNERFDEDHSDPKLADLNRRLNEGATQIEDLILSIWDQEMDQEEQEMDQEQIALMKAEIANELDSE